MAKEYSTPGPRAIYPEMCDSRSLARCGILANALWPRLVAQSDDQGRLAGDAVDVLGLCFPKMLDRVTVRAVRAALDELEAAGQVIRYQVGAESYIQIVTWWNWQQSQRRAYPSRYPSPPGWADAVYGYDEHPKTYREARGLPPRKRSEEEDPEPQPGTLPEPHGAVAATAPEPQQNGTVPAPEPHGAANARAQPRARGARPGPADSMPEKAPRSSRTTARANGTEQPVRLTKAQLEAWRSFGPEWDDVKTAWLERGFRHPPSGSPDDDDTSQRGLLYSILDARPTDLVRWIRSAPGKSASDVIAWVLAQWHEVRAAAGEDEEVSVEGPSRGEAAEAIGSIMSRIPWLDDAGQPAEAKR